MKFKYAQIGLWHRPIIPVTVSYKNKEVSYLALIDSGADINIFHTDIADILGIDLSKLKKVQFAGISPSGSPSEGSFAEVGLDFGIKMSKASVLFSADISDNGYGILGQQGFFNTFKVTFEYSKRQIIITETISRKKN